MSGALTKWSFYFLFYVNTIDNNFRCGMIFKKANCKVLDCLTYYCIWRWEDSYILLLILLRTNQWKTSSLSYTRYLQVHIVQLLYLLASSSYSNVIIFTTYNSGFSKKKVLLYTLQLIERANYRTTNRFSCYRRSDVSYNFFYFQLVVIHCNWL